MTIKKFDPDLFVSLCGMRKMPLINRKRFYYRFRWEVFKTQARKQAASWRDMLLNKWRDIVKVDNKTKLTLEQLYAISTKEERFELLILMFHTIEKRKRLDKWRRLFWR